MLLNYIIIEIEFKGLANTFLRANLKNINKDRGCSSEVEHLPNVCEGPGSTSAHRPPIRKIHVC